MAHEGGKRRRRTKSGFATKREARAAGRQALYEYENVGEVVVDNNISYSDFLDFWIENDCKNTCKEQTIKGYEKKIKLYIKPELGAYRIKSINKDNLQAFITDLYNDGFSVNTVTSINGLLTKNAMKEQANDVFEICSYVDGLEKKIDSMTEELTNMQNQIKEMQEDTLINNAKKALSEAQERLNARCEQIKSQVLEVKEQVKSTAKGIVEEAKEKGRAALYRVSEFLGIKKRFLDIRENVRGAIKTTDKDIAKTALLAKGFREAGQTVANAFRTFADKPEVDYSQKEQKHPITKAVLAPMKAVKKMLVSIEIHLDASIDKLDNLAMDVRMDKEKNKDDMKHNDQMEADRKEAAPERVEAEIVYAPVVAETHEYQYNADAFEARGAADMKVEIGKEVSKVREDKAR